MWYKIYFIGKLKIMLIVNEIIFLCYFTIVIQLLGFDFLFIFGVLMPLSAIFQLYHGDKF
jgi:hypothetical protein